MLLDGNVGRLEIVDSFEAGDENVVFRDGQLYRIASSTYIDDLNATSLLGAPNHVHIRDFENEGEGINNAYASGASSVDCWRALQTAIFSIAHTGGVVSCMGYHLTLKKPIFVPRGVYLQFDVCQSRNAAKANKNPLIGNSIEAGTFRPNGSMALYVLHSNFDYTTWKAELLALPGGKAPSDTDLRPEGTKSAAFWLQDETGILGGLFWDPLQNDFVDSTRTLIADVGMVIHVMQGRNTVKDVDFYNCCKWGYGYGGASVFEDCIGTPMIYGFKFIRQRDIARVSRCHANRGAYFPTNEQKLYMQKNAVMLIVGDVDDLTVDDCMAFEMRSMFFGFNYEGGRPWLKISNCLADSCIMFGDFDDLDTIKADANNEWIGETQFVENVFETGIWGALPTTSGIYNDARYRDPYPNPYPVIRVGSSCVNPVGSITILTKNGMGHVKNNSIGGNLNIKTQPKRRGDVLDVSLAGSRQYPNICGATYIGDGNSNVNIEIKDPLSKRFGVDDKDIFGDNLFIDGEYRPKRGSPFSVGNITNPNNWTGDNERLLPIINGVVVEESIDPILNPRVEAPAQDDMVLFYDWGDIDTLTNDFSNVSTDYTPLTNVINKANPGTYDAFKGNSGTLMSVVSDLNNHHCVRTHSNGFLDTGFTPAAGAFSVGLVVKIPAPSARSFYGCNDGSNHRFFIDLQVSGALLFGIGNTTFLTTETYTTDDILKIRITGSGTEFNAWVNDVKVVDAQAYTFSGTSADNVQLLARSSSGGTTQTFNDGRFGVFTLYNKVLDSTELTELDEYLTDKSDDVFKIKVILGGGQSNLHGVNSGADYYDIAKEKINSRIIQIVTPVTYGTSGDGAVLPAWEPLKGHARAIGSVGLMFHAAKEYLARVNDPYVRVLLVPAAVGNTGFTASDTGLGDWQRTTGILYQNLVAKANLALAKAVDTELLWLIWQQGEYDATKGVTQSAYAAYFDDFMAGLRADITGATNLIVTSGGTVSGFPTSQVLNAIIDLPNRDPLGFYIPSSSYANDGLHFTRSGSVLMARAHANIALEELGIEPVGLDFSITPPDGLRVDFLADDNVGGAYSATYDFGAVIDARYFQVTLKRNVYGTTPSNVENFNFHFYLDGVKAHEFFVVGFFQNWQDESMLRGHIPLNVVYDSVRIVWQKPTGQPTDATDTMDITGFAIYDYIGTHIIPSDETLIIPCGDETTDLTTGTKYSFKATKDLRIVALPSASVNTAPTGANLIVDINVDGTSILSTKLSIDAAETISETAATAAVLSTKIIRKNSIISVDVDQIGSSVASAGLKVYIPVKGV